MRTLSTTMLLFVLSHNTRTIHGFATPHLVQRNGISTRSTLSPYYPLFATDPSVDPEVKSLNPTPILWKYAKPIALGIALLSATTVFDGASAAMSGGRMGGSFSAPTRSAPMPRMSGGYRGGGGAYYGGGGAALMAPSPMYYAPAAPMLYGSPGVMTVSRGWSPFDFLVLGGFGFVFISSLLRGGTEGVMEEGVVTGSALGDGVSVARVSVAIEVPNRDDRGSLLSVLAQTARSANTETRRGVQQLTSQVALEVLRRKASIVAGSTSYQHFRDVRKAERTFNQWSVDERSKFEKENTNRFGGTDRSVKGERTSSNESRATMAVVTFVLSIQGDSTKVPKIRSTADLEAALSRVAADSKVDDCLLSAEILWTPEDRNEVLTRRDVVADYPGLIDV